MKSDEILDHNFSLLFADYLHEDEQIIWEGKPKPEFTITLLELGGHHDVMTGPTSILGIVIGAILIIGYIYYSSANWLGLVLTILFGCISLIAPDLIKNERKKNTKYAISNKRVFFHLWRWGKKSIHWFDFNEVAKITYQEYGDKSGIIHFLPKSPFNFFTYDFISSKKRFYPTFEMMPDVVELSKWLEKIRKERKNNLK